MITFEKVLLCISVVFMLIIMNIFVKPYIIPTKNFINSNIDGYELKMCSIYDREKEGNQLEYETEDKEKINKIVNVINKLKLKKVRRYDYDINKQHELRILGTIEKEKGYFYTEYIVNIHIENNIITTNFSDYYEIQGKKFDIEEVIKSLQ